MKKGNILVILLIGTVIVLSLSAVGYLFLQNRQLQSQIVKTPPPVQNLAPTNNFPAPTPVSTTSPTIDPTANWFTVNFTSHKFTFKVPPGWVTVKNMMTGELETFTNNMMVTRDQSLIYIMSNKDSKDSIVIDFNRSIDQRITKNGTDPVLDQILSTFKFL